MFGESPVSWFPTPTDDTYEFLPIEPSAITVGTALFSVMEVTGFITGIVDGSGGGTWTYFLEVELPDGSTVTDAASLPDDPAGQSPFWWMRFRIVRRGPKPDPQQLLSAPDSSVWIYPGTDGRVTCYRAADTTPVWPRGSSVWRGEWTVAAEDIYTAADPLFDWFPINDPTELSVGDVVTFSRTFSVDVDEVTVDASNSAFTRTTFLNASTPIGWVDQLDPGAVPGGYRWGFMERVPFPAVESLWQSTDGAKWIYAGAGVFYCFAAGQLYRRGEAVGRAQVVGGLTEWNP